MLIALLLLIALTLLLGANALFAFLGATIKALLTAALLSLAVYTFNSYPMAVTALLGLSALALLATALYEHTRPAKERQRRKAQKLAARLGVEESENGGYQLQE
ncbi:hypothetical protein [Spongiibacter sp. UBA1325]|uniref:hypothetical protein n=1 Tax=Spongiibacter sp. UBA1325 TaxID=1947543 RepID=UPI00257B0FE2|nr:hypothetical protein [Spongiibacter sp. UBA1325]|tara:strand:+ start:2050 stop:2361 length:312 start_codon:yes stop_codon:yes gene_type:complete